MDYLIEEVLRQQPESIQTFLLRTSILDRLCGPLCDAVLGVPSASGQATLEYLQRANLFIVPLDDERRWYRYHHLFSELLRQRLNQSAALGTGEKGAVEIHIRASEWYENNKMILEAFQHAAAANDIERAERLMELKEMPLHLPGVPTTILKWLESLPVGVLNSKPALWWKQAAMILSSEQIIGVEEKLRATEAALASKIPPHTEMDEWTRNLVGKIAVARALIEQTHYRIDTSMIQARRALEYLHPNNVAYRSTATQVLGFAHYIQGDRDAAERAYTESLSLAQSAGDTEGVLLATTRLGQIHETRNNQHMAADTYQRALQLIKGDQHPFASVPYLGLARISLEWNDLESAEKYAEQSFQLAKLCDQVIDRLILSELFLSRLKLIQGDSVGASFYLSQAEQNVRQKDFVVRLPDVAAVQALIHLYQGNTGAAAKIAQQNDVPLIQARVHIAQGDPSAALAVLEPYQQQADEKRLEDRRLRALVLEAVALHILGEKTQAMQVIDEVLALAEPGGFIRLFLENGSPMAQLLREAGAQGVMPDYTAKLLAAFEAEDRKSETKQGQKPAQLLNEPLSQRENEILKLIALGLSNREIGERLFLALDTVKGHNRRIFDKLQVQSRTEAIARARELEILKV